MQILLQYTGCLIWRCSGNKGTHRARDSTDTTRHTYIISTHDPDQLHTYLIETRTLERSRFFYLQSQIQRPRLADTTLVQTGPSRPPTRSEVCGRALYSLGKQLRAANAQLKIHSCDSPSTSNQLNVPAKHLCTARCKRRFVYTRARKYADTETLRVYAKCRL